MKLLRLFTWLIISAVALHSHALASPEKRTVTANHVVEWTFTSQKPHSDPFNEVTLDASITTPDGRELFVPGFWAGGQTWKVRYASPKLGVHHFKTICSDASDAGLHGIEGEATVEPYRGKNALYRHGPPVTIPGERHMRYADGTPFFWLGDTWWMGLCKRFEWPAGFDKLAADRVKKGFTVIQIVAGLYPDMGAFDERGANEAGFPWTKDYSRIEPAYFDAADRRIERLVESGLAPCIVGAWGYHLPWLGAVRMEKHWRYVIARWGAYPVFWCVAGEANLPYYLVPGFPFDDRKQVAGWTEVTRYVRQTDPYHRPISIHPTGLGRLTARGAVDDESLLDFDMLQTGHGDRGSLQPTVDTVRSSYAAKLVMPVLNSEVAYEGILNSCHDDVQRLMFWSCILSGACGHTYGANGIWQMNQRGIPYGKSPHGGTYGPTPWEDAMNLPGSGQLGMAKAFLMKYPWEKLEPHPEWVAWPEGTAFPDDKRVPRPYWGPYCAGITGKLRIVYLPFAASVRMTQLGKGAWKARWFDPVSGTVAEVGSAKPDSGGTWTSAQPPKIGQDWVLVVEQG